MGSAFILLLLFTSPLFMFPGCDGSKQAERLRALARSQRQLDPGLDARRGDLMEVEARSLVNIVGQAGSMEADKITALPGQPEGVNFNQYAGYITVDAKNGRALFYYFVESPDNSSTKPLVLWLNGGPGCSSLGFGAMEELGPFRVNSDGKTLRRNDYAWNKVANIIFLESPAKVGFSYSNTTSDYDKSGDVRTAVDSYTFLVNWFQRFPQYRNRDFYIAGESYAGHYIPDLASLITLYNANSSRIMPINLKGVAIGNAYLDGPTTTKGGYDFLWMHNMFSDETHAAIRSSCNFTAPSDECMTALDEANLEISTIDPYNIYAPVCYPDSSRSWGYAPGSAAPFDPCAANFIQSYLNLPEVQKALHANVTGIPGPWTSCQDQLPWDEHQSDHSMLPEIKQLLAKGMRVWLYSGDVDSVCSVTSTRYALKTLGLPIQRPWEAWYISNEDAEVAGYVVEYKGLTFLTVRGAGHEVPTYQPSRALALFSSFLQGKLAL